MTIPMTSIRKAAPAAAPATAGTQLGRSLVGEGSEMGVIFYK